MMLKEALCIAANRAGGGGPEGMVNYLHRQAIENPGPFMSLLGKVIPLQVTGADGGPILIVTGVRRADDQDDVSR